MSVFCNLSGQQCVAVPHCASFRERPASLRAPHSRMSLHTVPWLWLVKPRALSPEVTHGQQGNQRTGLSCAWDRRPPFSPACTVFQQDVHVQRPIWNGCEIWKTPGEGCHLPPDLPSLSFTLPRAGIPHHFLLWFCIPALSISFGCSPNTWTMPLGFRGGAGGYEAA